MKNPVTKGFRGHFDKYVDTSIDVYRNGTRYLDNRGTGMCDGIGSGTSETRNWIVAAATVDSRTVTMIDYIPIYSSPIDAGFGYWDLD